MAKRRPQPLKNQKSDVNKRLDVLEDRMTNLEKSAQAALETLATGVAGNIKQMWDNQKELATSLSEIGETLAGAIEEIRNEKRQNPGTECQG